MFDLTDFNIQKKCRFIIEKVIGDLKRFRSLDNFRNSVVGHVLIDYRIASAMNNFENRRCYAGGDNAVQLARRIKRKLPKKQNILKFLLSKQLGKKSTSSINFEDINDFPKLTTSKLRDKIFYGPYQLKQGKSYLVDMLRNGQCYSVSQDIIRKIKKTRVREKLLKCKIIATNIVSRHRRGLKTGTNEYRNTYKVFIAYIPGLNRTRSIQGET